jgi:hypothetical protein
MHDCLQQLIAILAQRWRLLASNKALNLLLRGMCTVMYWCVAMAIKMATFLGAFVDCCMLPVALAAAGAIRIK